MSSALLGVNILRVYDCSEGALIVNKYLLKIKRPGNKFPVFHLIDNSYCYAPENSTRTKLLSFFLRLAEVLEENMVGLGLSSLWEET